MKIPYRFRMTVYAVSLVVFLSGILWELLDTFVHVETSIGAQKHPLEPWVLKAHGAAALFFVFVFGQLYSTHLRPSWRIGLKRKSGGFLVAMIVALIFSGYLLYYAGGDDTRDIVSRLHFWLGALSPAPFFFHLFRRARRLT